MFIVLLDDAFGRRTFGMTDDPVDFLADRVACNLLSKKQVAECQIFEVDASTLDGDAIVKKVPLLRKVHEAFLGGNGWINTLVAEKKMTPELAQQLRDEIKQRWPLQYNDWLKLEDDGLSVSDADL